MDIHGSSTHLKSTVSRLIKNFLLSSVTDHTDQNIFAPNVFNDADSESKVGRAMKRN